MHLIKNRTQIRYEFIKNPKYRIYFWHINSKTYEDLKQLLQQHKCVYTPCLGQSEHLCNFEYVGEYKIDGPLRYEKEIEITTPIPMEVIIKPKFQPEKEYFTEIMPAEMKNNRVVKEYQEILYERQGKNILAIVDKFWELENNERIIFF